MISDLKFGIVVIFREKSVSISAGLQRQLLLKKKKNLKPQFPIKFFSVKNFFKREENDL